MRQKAFGAEAGDRAVLWIRPRRMDRGGGSKWPVGKRKLARWGKVLPRPILLTLKSRFKRREPFVIPAEAFEATLPLADSHRVRLVADFLANRPDLRSTEWFRYLSGKLTTDGVAWHKSIRLESEADILGFLNDYVGGLVDSLTQDGFSDAHDGYASTAVIDADGRLCKTGSGNHRFAIAWCLDLPRYPVRLVGVHEDWAQAQGLLSASVPEILTAVAPVEAAHQ